MKEAISFPQLVRLGGRPSTTALDLLVIMLAYPLPALCLLFIHPRAPNLINLRSAGTMPA